MANYSIPIQDGVYDTSTEDVDQRGDLNTGFGHQMAIKLSDGSTITAGSIRIYCKGVGSDSYEEIPDSPIALDSIVTPLFEFYVQDYRFEVINAVGNGRIRITDMEINRYGRS